MMSSAQTACIEIDELESRVKAVEPAAFLVPPRLLRRVIKHHCQVGGIGFLVPHRRGFCLDRESLLSHIAPSELGLTANLELPPHVFLLVRPDSDRLAGQDRDQVLRKHWRILFHLRIDLILQQKLASGVLTSAMVRERIRRLGLTEFSEITDVLRQEDYLLPPESPASVYAEFVAVYLTMRRFDPARLPHFFPSLRDLDAVDGLVAEDIDADVIYDATRLTSSAAKTVTTEDEHSSAANAAPCNSVVLSPSADAELAQLSNRLKNALELLDGDAELCRRAMVSLMAQSADGTWTQEARFLHDLKSVCLDREEGVYAVDLVGWAMSLGQLPIKRQMPAHQQVAIVRHLRQALDRLRLVRLADAERQHLSQVLTHAVEHRERAMRECFRPLLASAFDEVGMKPHNVAEEIGRAKLIEELLDRVVENGHFNIGNLRDAISRNQMKLPDLSGPVELILGDPLIRLNRKLAVVLDGVYRRGEVYMRLLHRLSSLAFGTLLGRLLVLFLILPFGLAFFVMITPPIAIEEVEKLTRFVGQLLGLLEKPSAHHGHEAPHTFPLPNLWGVAGLGIFFLLLFHVGSFRSRFYYGMGKLGRGLQRIHADAVGLIHLPAVQAILHNRYWRLFRRCVLWPGLMATNGGLFAWWYDLTAPVIAGVAAGCLALGIMVFNTRAIRSLEETATDWLLRYWVWFTIDFVPGLLHLIMDLSHRCLDGVEQVLYTVNEWLRFRRGENQLVVAGKVVMGLLWFCVMYVIRFAINLLIEPQINPIKHFPVVTVSHKVCLPMIPTLADILRNTGAVSRPTTMATGVIFGIPGIFGFMVWELKENWKLYGANREADLKPEVIGSHGETLLRLLRPGFHSGTITKLYKKLRRAERHGQQETIRKIKTAMHHVEESVAHFVERELLALLRRSKSWAGLTVELKSVRLATNRVLMEVRCPTLDEKPLLFAFDHQGGWLVAGVLEPGWLTRLNAEQRQTLASAMTGLYKMAGVHATREQIAASLPATTFAFDIIDACLVVWTHADGSHDAMYDLSSGPELPPIPLQGILPAGMPVLDSTRLLFANVPVEWQDWVRACEGDYANGDRQRSPLAVLPL